MIPSLGYAKNTDLTCVPSFENTYVTRDFRKTKCATMASTSLYLFADQLLQNAQPIWFAKILLFLLCISWAVSFLQPTGEVRWCITHKSTDTGILSSLLSSCRCGTSSVAIESFKADMIRYVGDILPASGFLSAASMEFLVLGPRRPLHAFVFFPSLPRSCFDS